MINTRRCDIRLIATILCFVFGATACNGENASATAESKPAEVHSKSVATKSFDDATLSFFEDLPNASDIPPEEMGDLYFKILTRITTKVRAVRDEKAARSTRELIDYAHAQATILSQRAQALSDEAKGKQFQESLAQLTWAKGQYQRMLRRIGDDDPKYLRTFADYADKDWPQLR